MNNEPKYIIVMDEGDICGVEEADTIEEACEIAERYRKGFANRSRDAWVYSLHVVQSINQTR